MANNVNIVNRGFEYLAQWMGGNYGTAGPGGGGFTIPTVIGWGGANGYNDSAVVTLPGSAPTTTQGTGQWQDVGPFQEFSEARVTVTTGNTSIIGNSVGSGTVTTQFIGTITATQAHTAITNVGTGQVAESFLAFSATKPLSFTVVGGAVTAVQTSLTVNTTGGLANQYYQLNNEVIKITSTAASNLWNIARQQNASTSSTAVLSDTLTFGNIPGAGANNPNGGSAGGGDIFAHAGFVGLSLNNGDSIQFTWQINVTS